MHTNTPVWLSNGPNFWSLYANECRVKSRLNILCKTFLYQIYRILFRLFFVYFYAEDDVKKGVVPLCLTPEVLLILNHGFEHLTDTRITDQKLFKDLNYLQNALNSTKYLRVRFIPHFEPILFCCTNEKLFAGWKSSERLVFNTELEQLLRSHLHVSPFRAPSRYSCL